MKFSKTRIGLDLDTRALSSTRIGDGQKLSPEHPQFLSLTPLSSFLSLNHTHTQDLLCLYSKKKQLDMLLFNIVYCKIET